MVVYDNVVVIDTGFVGDTVYQNSSTCMPVAGTCTCQLTNGVDLLSGIAMQTTGFGFPYTNCSSGTTVTQPQCIISANTDTTLIPDSTPPGNFCHNSYHPGSPPSCGVSSGTTCDFGAGTTTFTKSTTSTTASVYVYAPLTNTQARVGPRGPGPSLPSPAPPRLTRPSVEVRAVVSGIIRGRRRRGAERGLACCLSASGPLLRCLLASDFRLCRLHFCFRSFVL